MEPVTAVLQLSAEVERLLIQNDVDLLKELQKEGVALGRAPRPPELPFAQEGTKGIELIILASAVAAPVIASAVARVIDAVARNRRALVRQVDYEVLTEKPMPQTRPLGDTSKHTVKVAFLGFKVEMSDEYKS